MASVSPHSPVPLIRRRYATSRGPVKAGSVYAKVQVDKGVADMNRLFPNCPYFPVTFTVPAQFRTLLFEKRAWLNAVFSSSVETLLSCCKEQGFLPAVTAVLPTFGSDLKRQVHIHCLLSAGGLKLTGKAERFTRFIKRKQRDPHAKREKVSVLMENPEWIPWSNFPYKMLQKRYQALLIELMKEPIRKNIHSDTPDPDLKVFSEPAVMTAFFDDLRKEYQNGFFVYLTEERKDLELTAAGKVCQTSSCVGNPHQGLYRWSPSSSRIIGTTAEKCFTL
jgi:hypothetical protein